MKELDDNFIDKLLAPNIDPIIWYEQYWKCVSRGCGSPTRIRVKGIPYCMMHTIHKCNELLKELGVTTNAS